MPEDEVICLCRACKFMAGLLTGCSSDISICMVKGEAVSGRLSREGGRRMPRKVYVTGLEEAEKRSHIESGDGLQRI